MCSFAEPAALSVAMRILRVAGGSDRGGLLLPVNIPFTEARHARMMTIVLALTLSFSTSTTWFAFDEDCRFLSICLPPMIVFGTHVHVYKFGREPGCDVPPLSVEHHAIRRGGGYASLFRILSLLLPTLLVFFSAYATVLFNEACPHADAKAMGDSQR